MKIEHRPLIRFDIEEEALALALPRHLRRQAGVVPDRREILEPIHVAGSDVEAQKIARETAPRRSFEVRQRR